MGFSHGKYLHTSTLTYSDLVPKVNGVYGGPERVLLTTATSPYRPLKPPSSLWVSVELMSVAGRLADLARYGMDSMTGSYVLPRDSKASSVETPALESCVNSKIAHDFYPPPWRRS